MSAPGWRISLVVQGFSQVYRAVPVDVVLLGTAVGERQTIIVVRPGGEP